VEIYGILVRSRDDAFVSVVLVLSEGSCYFETRFRPFGCSLNSAANLALQSYVSFYVDQSFGGDAVQIQMEGRGSIRRTSKSGST
jgi:hypothetical protein